MYYYYSVLAWIRGFLGYRLIDVPSASCTTGLNGKGEAKLMYEKHNWIPWMYRKTKTGTARTFLTENTL